MIDDEEDCRPVKTVWADLDGMISGAKQRGMAEDRIDRLRGFLSHWWTRASRTAERAKAQGVAVPPRPAGWQKLAIALADWPRYHREYVQECVGLCWAIAAGRVYAGQLPEPDTSGRPEVSAADAALLIAGRTCALSLVQLWCWIILCGGKRIENRRWSRTFPKETIYMHASQTMRKRDYKEAVEFSALAAPWLKVPPFDSPDLHRGGIVGSFKVTGHRANLDGDPGLDRWAMPGQYGYQLADVRALPFTRCKGALGFWRVPRAVRDALELQEGWPCGS